jgi:hypothetical protein
MLRRLLTWINRCWEVLFYLPPERPAAEHPAPARAEDIDHIGMVI